MPVVNKVSPDIVNRFVLRKQHLADDARIDDIIRITRDICGLHATGNKEPYLALFARSCNFVKESLDEELRVRKTMGKFRCMRATLYILTGEMIPVVYAATRVMVEKNSRRYAEFRGISATEHARISRSVLDLIKGREMTAAGIKAALGTQLYLSAALNLMCDQGLLVRVQSKSNWDARSYRYASFSEYFPDINLAEFNESEGLLLLVQQYLRAFGPATENDIAWWTGLGKTKVREALSKIGGRIAKMSIDGLEGDFIVLRSELDSLSGIDSTDKPIVNLLPALDPYIMGYKERERYLSREYYGTVFDRSGNATSTVMVDGKIVGVWGLATEKRAEVRVYLFDDVTADVWQQIKLESVRMGLFVTGKKVAVRRVSSMTPLQKRPAGAFMSPLRSSE